jgi:hypothetical protein
MCVRSEMFVLCCFPSFLVCRRRVVVGLNTHLNYEEAPDCAPEISRLPKTLLLVVGCVLKHFLARVIENLPGIPFQHVLTSRRFHNRNLCAAYECVYSR